MDLFKKTILLTSSDVKCGGMGVLTLIKSGNGVFGNFKVYNMRSSSNLVLGILINGKTIKEKVFINENNNFKLETDFDRDSQISCVLVDKQQDKVVPLVWFCGTKEISKIEIMNIVCKDEFLSNRRKLCGIDKLDEDKFGENVCDFFSNLNQKDQKVGFVDDNKLIKNNNNFDNAINNVDKNYNKVQKHDLDNTDYNDDEGKNLKVKEEFFEYTDEEIEEEIDKNLEKPFYDLIKSQIDDLFSKYPSEKFLENLIENSKWVKIDFEITASIMYWV